MTLHHASTLIELGRHQEALEALAELGDDAVSARAHCLRARACLGLGRTKEAEQAAAAAVAADPNEEWGYRLASIAAGERGKRKESLRLAKEAVRIAPWEPNTHQVAALCAIDVEDKDTAAEHARELLRLAPDRANSHVTWARSLLLNGKAREAEEPLRKALELDPQDHEAMTLLADVVGRRNKEEARELRLAAVRAAPHDSHLRKNLLKRGGLAAGAGIFAVGKIGFVGKLVAISSVRHVGELFTDLVIPLFVAIYVTLFAVTRVRRRMHGRRLPALVWEGLRAERRNADLMWLVWPALVVLLGGSVSTLVQLLSGNPPVGLLLVLGASAVLSLCWRWRLGEIRQRAFRDVLSERADFTLHALRIKR